MISQIALMWLAASTSVVDIQERGGITGNGGDVIDCPHRPQVHYDLLDYVEAYRYRLPIQIDGDTYVEKLERALSRLERLDPRKADRYRTWVSEFLDEADFPEDIDLRDIPDSDHVGIPAGCQIKQVAVQKQPQFPNEPRYTINGSIWRYWQNRTDRATQMAGLVLHEIIYRDALLHGHENSIFTRFFTALISSPAIESYTQEQYDALILNSGMDRIRWFGLAKSFSFSEQPTTRGEGQSNLDKWCRIDRHGPSVRMYTVPWDTARPGGLDQFHLDLEEEILGDPEIMALLRGKSFWLGFSGTMTFTGAGWNYNFGVPREDAHFVMCHI